MIGLHAPGYPLWYATAVSLVSLAQGQDCTRLRAWNGLTLLLGSPQQAPSRCHTSVVLRLGILCISAWELPSEFNLHPGHNQIPLALTFLSPSNILYKMLFLSLLLASYSREQVESTDIGEK